MTKLKNPFRLADNLTEILIFDVALATPRRRRVAASMAILAGCGAYLLSGVILTPRYSPPTTPGPDGAPYIQDSTWKHPGQLVSQVVHDRKLPAGGTARLEAELARLAPPMDAARRLLLSEMPPLLEQLPWFANIRELNQLLIVRGMVRASKGEGDEAMNDWLAAAQLGLVMRGCPGHRDMTMIEAIVSISLEKAGMGAIQRHIEGGPLDPSQRVALRQYFEHRRVRNRSLASYVEGERKILMQYLDAGVTQGAFSLDPFDGHVPSGYGLLMPARHEDRANFVRAMRRSMDNLYNRLLEEARLPSPRRIAENELDSLMTGDGTVVCNDAPSYLRALFSQRIAAAYMSRKLAEVMMPNLPRVRQHIDELESMAHAVELRIQR